MYSVPTSFHTNCKAQSPRTRIRIYFITNAIDCTNDTAVQTNGILLKRYENDTDSNGRVDISSSPVTVTEYYNPNDNIEIGRCASNTISFTLFNDDGALNNFEYGRFKVYLDLYSDGAWVSVPLGVFVADMPQKRRVSRVVISAYDQMRVFDAGAADWWQELDFSSGLSYWQIVQMMCATLNVPIASASQNALCNNAYTFNNYPFGGGDFTYREVLAAICEANGCNAMFNRDGALLLSYYGTSVGYGYSEADGIFSFDQCEYIAEPITGVSVKATNDDVGVLVGSGNTYLISNNKFFNASPDAATSETLAGNILSVLSANENGYTPISLVAVGDWSLCAGDMIPVSFGGINYVTPIMQQTLAWSGGGVRSTVIANGTRTLPSIESAPIRQQLETSKNFHDLKVTVDTLLSRIESINGDYSAIEQTVNAITQTVGTLNQNVTNILDPNGEIWTFVNGTADKLANLDASTSAQFATLSTYIRFTSEPAIILGVNGGDDIKLKLVNNVIYFFSGSDDSTDLTNAFAYFNSEGVNAGYFTAENQVQIGSAESGNWLWHKIENGNLVLDLI